MGQNCGYAIYFDLGLARLLGVKFDSKMSKEVNVDMDEQASFGVTRESGPISLDVPVTRPLGSLWTIAAG